jgi:hypothetical protein
LAIAASPAVADAPPPRDHKVRPLVRKPVRHRQVAKPQPKPLPKPTPCIPCGEQRATNATNCPPLKCPLTPEETQIARTAWGYFEHNLQPETGLVNSTDGYPSATIWDEASALLATFSAYRLGILPKARYDALISQALASLARLPLYEGVLPNKAYNTATLQMVDYGNNPAPLGIGYSALDIARLTTALQILRACDEAHRPQIDQVMLGWRWQRLFGPGGQLMGAVRVNGVDTPVQEGRLGYQEYATRALERLGAHRFLPPPVAYKNMYGIEVPYDARDPRKLQAHTYVVSEPYILGAVELGLPSQLADWSRRVFTVQQRRHAATGQITAVSEDHLDRAPYFVYNTVLADGFPWRAITDSGEDAEAFKAISTKAAFGWSTLYNTPYANLTWDAVRQGFVPGRGFYAGRYQRDLGYNKALTANTNGIILECLLYAKLQHPLIAPAAGVGRWERYRATVADLRGLPGGRGLKQPTPRRPGPVGPEELADARTAWRYFQRNTWEGTGLVAQRDQGPVADMASAGDGLIAIAAAERLGILAPADGLARARKLVGTLKRLPLAQGKAPAQLYGKDGGFAWYDGKAVAEPLGWDALELGRLLSGMAAVGLRHPELMGELEQVQARWVASALVHDGRLWNANGQSAGRVGSEQYAALGFRLWGLKAELALDGSRDRDFRELGAQEVPVDRRPDGFTTSGPWIQALLEHPLPGRLALEAPYLYQAQWERAHATGRVVAADAGPLDREPWRSTDALATTTTTWEAFGPEGQAMPGLRAFSVGAAAGWAALYDTAYAPVLSKALRPLATKDGGFLRGRFEQGDMVDVSDAHTNALVLEAAAFRAQGPLLFGWAAAHQGDMAEWAAHHPAAPQPGSAAPLPTQPPAVGAGWASPGWLGGPGHVSGSFAVGTVLGPRAEVDVGTQTTRGQTPPNQAYGMASLELRPTGSLFLRLNALRYFDPTRQRPWDPDFTYALGYDDWRPNTFYAGYENYSGNRWGTPFNTVLQGTLRAGYKLPALPWWPASWGEWRAQVGYGLVPRFQDAAGATYEFKHSLDGRLSYRAFNLVDLWISPHYYFMGAQQPWDPDYSYGLDVTDYKPWTLWATYGNYAGNRWPGHAGGQGQGPLDGVLSVGGSWGF